MFDKSQDKKGVSLTFSNKLIITSLEESIGEESVDLVSNIESS